MAPLVSLANSMADAAPPARPPGADPLGAGVAAGPSGPEGPSEQTEAGTPPSAAESDVAPRQMEWSIPGGRVSAAVYGGTFTVDTADLEALAYRLDEVAGWLASAREYVLTQYTQVEEAPLPGSWLAGSVGGSQAGWGGGAGAWVGRDAGVSGVLGRAQGTAVPFPGGALDTSGLPEDFSYTAYFAARTRAKEALLRVASGPVSLTTMEVGLRDLAYRVRAAAATYEEAEAGAGGAWSGDLALVASGFQAMVGAPSALGLLASSGVIGALLEGRELPEGFPADVYSHLRTILADPTLASWATKELAVLVVLGAWLAQNTGSRETGEVERYLASAATRLDQEITPRLPHQVQHGSRIVKVSELSPMQRVSTYLALAAAAAGERRYGRRAGLRLQAHGGSGFVAPRLPGDPLGLRVPLNTGPLAGRPVTPPGSPSEVIRYSDGLKKNDKDPSTGVISLLRTDHADGRRTWLVVVPGTTDWGAGDRNPQDMLTNFEAVAGMPTDMEKAVVAAMRAAGVQQGEDVALYGHSQGAITVSNLAADPGVAERFSIRAALTAGGPVAGAAIPASVASLHLENGNDAVTSLDARPNPVRGHRTTVVLDTSQAGIPGYEHGSLVYAQALENMPDDPAIAAWNERLRAITGAGEEGATTTETVIDLERIYEPSTPAKAEP